MLLAAGISDSHCSQRWLLLGVVRHPIQHDHHSD